MDTGSITKIIGKFLQGSCSDEEFAYLLYWYESFDEDPSIELNEEDKELLRTKILNHIRHHIPELDKKSHRLPNRKARRVKRATPWWKYAVAAAVIGLVAWSGFHYYYHPSRNRRGSRQESAAGSLITLNNKSNRMHFFTLPDSSKVWLSPNSRIEYPEKFVGSKRTVRLHGEAFFEIYKNPSCPFIVISGALTTRVLGTSFLLKAYNDKPIEVSVMTGEVEVSLTDKKGERLKVSAKQKAILGFERITIKKSDADKATVRRWQKVNLSFDNVSFAQVVQALDKKFDIQIHCQQRAMYQYKLKADFNNQNLMVILEMLERSLNIHYEMTTDSVINFYTNINSL